MNAALTIEEFNAVLNSKEASGSLLSVLRKLMAVERPEDVVARAQPLAGWGWRVATPTDR
jgi:hypothetical protein